MVDIKEYGDFETAWCPGCGNHGLLNGLKKALAELDIAPHQYLHFSGIGQAAKAPQYLNCNMFNGLHGRSLPAAQGARLANPDIPILVESGDGCNYGEGGNHFIAALRRNMNLTLLAHDNQIYGLTKGQASPTTAKGQHTKAQPYGQPSEPFNPIAVAVAMKAGFVARGFVGDMKQLAELIVQAMNHKGFALVDVFQPCVSFNHVNTYKWYKEHTYTLGDDHDPSDWSAAMGKAMETEKMPLGVIYRNDRPPFEDGLPTMKAGPLARRSCDKQALQGVLRSFI